MTITAKYPGTCETCHEAIVPGQQIEWDKATKTTRHVACATEETPEVERAGGFAPTDEQTGALEKFLTGKSLAIEAGAGTGKTSTLQLLSETSRGRKARGQYIAFNKAIVTEAGEKMAGVNCATAHALAFRAVGRKYAERLRTSKRMRSDEIASILKLSPITITTPEDKQKRLSSTFLAGLAMRSVVRFCQSADLEPAAHHVPKVEGIDIATAGRNGVNNRTVQRALLPAMKRAWDDLMDEHGRLPFRHDHYLKAWHLSGPRIGADYILFDEAQDANPVMMAIVAAQTHAQLVWVGDSQQQIYSFTGAVNALAKVPADSRAFLTQSFRFGPAIADVANSVLDRIDGAELRLIGTESIASTVGSVDDPDAILCRTNATAVQTVLRLQGEGKTVALVGGGDEVVRFAKAAQQLMKGEQTEHPELACFESWGEVQRYVSEDEQGGELRLLVKLVDDFGVEAILEALDRTIREADADVVISTAHKAKGREWNRVQLAGDFPETPEDEELRLLYVAVTRARRELDIDAVFALRSDDEDDAVAPVALAR